LSGLILLLAGRDEWRAPGSRIEIGRKAYWTIAAADVDVDGDGKLDLVAPNYGHDTVSILLGDGRGHFAHAQGSPFAAGPVPFAATIADMNGDGRPDVVVANYSGHAARTEQDGLTWIRNDGNHRFTPFATRLARGRYTARVVTGDVNGDGFNDPAFSNGNGATVTIVYGSRGGPVTGIDVPTMQSPHALTLADLNGDARADLAVASEDSAEVLLFLSR
jgi:hypothetical protein